MPLYKKNPVVIEAIQWDGTMESLQAIKEMGCKCPLDPNRVDAILIETLEGTMTGNKGDWIIKGVKGSSTPASPTPSPLPIRRPMPWTRPLAPSSSTSASGPKG